MVLGFASHSAFEPAQAGVRHSVDHSREGPQGSHGDRPGPHRDDSMDQAIASSRKKLRSFDDHPSRRFAGRGVVGGAVGIEQPPTAREVKVNQA